jgi:hypothetical protein
MNFCHIRNQHFHHGITAKGGVTVCMEKIQPWFLATLKPGDFFEKKVGIARCRDDENYCKKIGREVAQQNAKARKLTVQSVHWISDRMWVVLLDDQGIEYSLLKYAKAKEVFLSRVSL